MLDDCDTLHRVRGGDRSVSAYWVVYPIRTLYLTPQLLNSPFYFMQSASQHDVTSFIGEQGRRPRRCCRRAERRARRPRARGGRVVEEGVRDMRQQDVLVGMGVDDCEVRHVRLALCHQVLRRLHWREPLRPEHARARALCKPSKKAG